MVLTPEVPLGDIDADGGRSLPIAGYNGSGIDEEADSDNDE